MRSGWIDAGFGSSRKRLARGLELSTSWSHVRGEGNIGYVFGQKLKKTGLELDEIQAECELVATSILKKALADIQSG